MKLERLRKGRISAGTGVWRGGGEWLVQTHNGVREVRAGSIVFRFGRKTWVWF